MTFMPQNSFVTVSQKIIQAYNKLCEPLLEEFDIPRASFDILMFLHNNPNYSTAQEICEVRHIKKNLVSVHVEKLVSAGLLERSTVEGDRRKIGLSCTEKATPIVEAGKAMQTEFFKDLTSDIDEEMWQMLSEMTSKLDANADRMLKGK